MNPLIGKFYLIPNSSEQGPHGKAEIIEHLYDQYYYVICFDLCSNLNDFGTVIHLKDIHALPLFASEEELELFFGQIDSHTEPRTEVEVSH